MIRILQRATIAAVIATIVVIAQWGIAFGGDNFTLVQHQDRQYKVFSYGFPFKVTDANEVLDLNTPADQARWRIIGNWAAWFGVGVITLTVIKTFRTTPRNVFSTRADAG